VFLHFFYAINEDIFERRAQSRKMWANYEKKYGRRED
jgi:hypothetical protein